MISEQKSITVLGYFDGVHLGHRALLVAAVKEKKRLGGRVTVLTFDALPGKSVITPKKLRVGWLKLFGADDVILEPFSFVKDMSAEDFAKKTVREQHSTVLCVCGYNYHFGRGGVADAEELKKLGGRLGMDVTVVPKLTLSESSSEISSTSLRTLLLKGNLNGFYSVSGHHFATCGEVVHGRQFGRTVGLPTVNQLPGDACLLPPNGVYATYCLIDGKYYPSVTNIGSRPTFFPDGEKLLETHIIGFSGELYGRDVPIGYLGFLRGEKKFDTDAALVKEIENNISEAKTLFLSEEKKLLLPELK